MSNLDDKAMVGKCCSGDHAAWNELANHYFPVIQGTVRRVFRSYQVDPDTPDFDDVCQEVFVRILQHDARVLRSFRWQSSLKTWLSLVASSCAVDHLRKKHKREIPITDYIDKISTEIVPSSEEFDRSEISALNQAKERLLPRDKLLIKLAYERKWSYEQISKLIGISVNTVGPAIHRAITRLEKAFSEIKKNNIGARK